MVRCGSSAMIVPTPTMMASYFLRRFLTLVLSSSDEILTWVRSSPASFPSADIAQLTWMNGLIVLTGCDSELVDILLPLDTELHIEEGFQGVHLTEEVLADA